jgi:glycosyltransferase involved in cell wall biosynthesis
MYSKYAAIACIGISARDALRDWLDQEGPPITIIPNGIDVERFARESKARKKGKASTGATILICVANLADGKGHEVLLHAVSLLPATELLLVGEGPKRSDLQRLTQELGIAERVRFLGRRNDVPELLATADIYVQPSYWEGFGIATLEAMAAGLPVVASDVPGLRDVVGDAGLLAPAGSAVDLANCIAQLLSDPDLQSRVALLAQQRSKQFSIETTASAYLQLYKSVLGYHDATKAETENVYHGEGGK